MSLLTLTSREDLSELQARIDASLSQLETIVDRIQQVSAENCSLRQDIAKLRQQLAF